MIKVFPSLLAADFSRLEEEVKVMDKAGCDEFHLDVMDGHFVPNISFGLPVIKSIRRHTQKPFDVHLMINPYSPYLEAFRDAGANRLTVHVEAESHLHRAIQKIKDLGCEAGVALNPATALGAIEEVLPDLDLVCIMTVNPGFGGQKFIDSQLDKIKSLRQKITAIRKPIKIQVDGGVDEKTAAKVLAAGADVLVAGTALFSKEQTAYHSAIEKLRKGA